MRIRRLTVALIATLASAGGVGAAVQPPTLASSKRVVEFGTPVVLSGTVAGAARSVTLAARPFGATRATFLGRIRVRNGHFSVQVSPSVTTIYTASAGGRSAGRFVYVRPAVRVSHHGHTVGATLRPHAVPRVALRILRREAGVWRAVGAMRTDASDDASRSGLPDGVYEVRYVGGGRYANGTSKPFRLGG